MTDLPGQSGPEESAPNQSAEETAAHRVIEAFGGIRPMAGKLGLAVSTVQGWKERDHIPDGRHEQILQAAAAAGIELDAADLIDKPGAPEEAAETEEPAEAPEPEADRAEPEADETEAAEPETTAESPESESASAAALAARLGGPAEQAPPPPTAASPAPAPKSGGSFGAGLAIGALALAAGIGIGIVTRGIWLPSVEEPSASVWDEGRIAALETERSRLEGRLASLESAPAGDDGASAALAALQGEVRALAGLSGELTALSALSDDMAAALSTLPGDLAALSERLDELEGRLAAGDSGAAEQLAGLSGTQGKLATRLEAAEQDLGQIAGLSARLDQLAAAAEARKSAGSGVSAVLGAMQLREALRGSGPFSRELALVSDLAADDPALLAALEPLRPYAATGLPGLADLRLAYGPAAAEAVAGERAAAAGDGWVSGVVRRVSNLVTVRPVGLVEGDSAAATVARAEVKLEAGDLAGALAELDGLEGDAAAAMADWRADAEARLAGEQAVTLLAAAMVPENAMVSEN